MVRLAVGIVACLTALLAVAPARACNIPVFRYALERWRPDPYEMVVIHRGPLNQQEQDLVDALRKYADSPKCISNFAVDTVDLAKAAVKDQEKLFKTYRVPQLPWVIVRYPDNADPEGPAWSGPLESATLTNLLDSPVRRELARRLLKGESAVWLFLDSGDKTADDKAHAELQAHLQKLEKTLKLPELTDAPKDKLLRDEVPLKIAFSILRVSRTDPGERILVHMLRHMERDLERRPTVEVVASAVALAGSPNGASALLAAAEVSPGRVRLEPIVYPVFGRGLALYALLGKGITEENIKEAASFLVGACSCEVKKLNPGVDLLMTADWEGELAGRIEPAPEVPLVGLQRVAAPPAPPQGNTPVLKCGNTDEGHASGSLLLWTVGGTAAAGLLAVLVVSLVLFCRAREQ